MFFAQCCCSDEPGQAVLLDPNAEEPGTSGLVAVKKLEPEPEEAAAADTEPAIDEVPPPFEYKVTVEKTAGCSILGFELDLLDGQRAQVCSVKPGVVENYNKTADDDVTIQSKDWVIEVNGVTGNVQDMYKRLKGDQVVSLLMRRTSTWKVDVNQVSKDGSLGMSVKRAAAGVSLLLLEVHNVFKAWNSSHPQRQVKKYDRIVEVNGISMNTFQMMEELQVATELKLVLMSPVE